MTERRCRYCQESFQLSKFQPRQLVCGELACQRKQQKLRDRKRHLRNLANNTSARDLKHSAAAVWLVGAGAEFLANNNSAPAQVFVIEALAPSRNPAPPPCKQHPSGLETGSAG
jgi:hypothetical protein